MNKYAKWGIAGAVAVALVVVTWLLASRFQSPAQRQAAAKPPTAKPIVATITQGDLVDDTTAQAQLTMVGKLTWKPTTDGTVVITTAPEAGKNYGAGSAPLWINGKPVLVMPGAYPFYRDLGPGDQGSDVKQLQQALTAAGYNTKVTGTFNKQTENHLRQLFKKLGYQLPKVPAPRDSGEGDAPSEPAAAPKLLERAHTLVAPSMPVQFANPPQVGTKPEQVDVAYGEQKLATTVPAEVAAKLTQQSLASTEVDGNQIQLRIVDISSKNATDQSGEDKNTDSPQNVGPVTDSPSTITFEPASDEVKLQPDTQYLVQLQLGEPVMDALIVPQAAIANSSQGTSTVLLEKGKNFAAVNVEVQKCLGGKCAVTGKDIKTGGKVRLDR